MSKITHAEYADGLRKLADFFEAHPEVPLPYDAASYSYYAADTKEEMATIAKALGHAEKKFNDHFFYLIRDFGKIRFEAFADRGSVCTRKQVGVKHVEEHIVPAHDVPVYTYDCPESILNGKEDEAA